MYKCKPFCNDQGGKQLGYIFYFPKSCKFKIKGNTQCWSRSWIWWKCVSLVHQDDLRPNRLSIFFKKPWKL